MKYIVLLSCLLASALAGVPNKKISLEDIETDNLRSEKPPKQTSTYNFLPVKTANDYARQQPKTQYLQAQYVPQQHYTPPPRQYATVSPPQPQYSVAPQQFYYQPQPYQYQQYDNVQYVSDNSINQQQAPQQYYTPQYVYLQQYTAPSNAIQTVVDPKGGVQYVMYIPTYVQKADQSQNYESVVYVNAPTAPEAAQYETRYASAPEGIKYAEPEPKTRYFTSKKEPKSLLDSYVPSILQLQYLKQQQAQLNALQQSVKAPSKTEQSKRSFRPGQAQAETVRTYNYQFPSP